LTNTKTIQKILVFYVSTKDFTVISFEAIRLRQQLDSWQQQLAAGAGREREGECVCVLGEQSAFSFRGGRKMGKGLYAMRLLYVHHSKIFSTC
jgi:hypothetical protein